MEKTRETVEILRMAYGKGAVIKLKSGKTAFVFGGVPGEVCDVEVVEDFERFCTAKIVSREVKAENIPGANWADLPYSMQLEQKMNCVRDALVRNAKFDEGLVDEALRHAVPSENEWNYRNKIELAYANNSLGMMQEGSNEFAEVKKFPLACKKIESSPKALSGALKFALHGEDCGLFRVGVRHSERTGDTQVALWTTPGWFPRHEVAKIISQAMDVTSIVRIIASKGKTRKIKQVEVLEGSPTWSEKLSSFKYSISAPSFFQVNTKQAEILQDLVLSSLLSESKESEGRHINMIAQSTPEHPSRIIRTSCSQNSLQDTLPSDAKSFLTYSANKTSEGSQCEGSTTVTRSATAGNCKVKKIADLYCGAGTFTLPLAKSDFDVVGVELAGSSTRDLKANLKKNHLQAQIICDEVERALPKLDNFDACVLDPPKCGLNKGVIKALIEKSPQKIVYVSCDPMTLARDLQKLCNAGYSLTSVTPVDMFPQTHHVETVVLMSKVQN